MIYMTSSIKKYWLVACIFCCLEIIALKYNSDGCAIACMGVVWVIMVIGYGIQVMRITDYYKEHYWDEYNKMLHESRGMRNGLKAQLTFDPGDRKLKILQQRLINYFRFSGGSFDDITDFWMIIRLTKRKAYYTKEQVKTIYRQWDGDVDMINATTTTSSFIFIEGYDNNGNNTRTYETMQGKVL